MSSSSSLRRDLMSSLGTVFAEGSGNNLVSLISGALTCDHDLSVLGIMLFVIGFFDRRLEFTVFDGLRNCLCLFVDEDVVFLF